MIKFERFLKHCKVRVNLFRHSDRSFIQKIRTNSKYYQFYLHHEQNQQQKIIKILEQVQKQKEQDRYLNKIKSMIRQYSFKNINEKMVKKKQQMSNRYDKGNFEQQTRSLMGNVLSYMSLYYQSLQNIVQGRREVLNNQNFKFQDNQTVKEKQDKFEVALSRIIGKYSDKTVKRSDQKID